MEEEKSTSARLGLDSDENEEEVLVYEDLEDDDELGLELHPENDLDLQAEP